MDKLTVILMSIKWLNKIERPLVSVAVSVAIIVVDSVVVFIVVSVAVSLIGSVSVEFSPARLA